MNRKNPVPKSLNISTRLIILAMTASAALAGWGDLPAMHNYKEVFDLGKTKPDFKVTMIKSNAPGNVFHPAEQPEFEFQAENLTDRQIKTQARIEIIRYAQKGRPGDNWFPELIALDMPEPLRIDIDLAPKAWRNVTIKPPTPETKGGYALIIDLADAGRAYLTSYVRTFKPDLKRIQFPAQSLEEMPAPILAKLGVQAIRWGASYEPTDSRRYAEQWASIEKELKEYQDHKITVVAEIGAGSATQPLGRGRPHLNDKNEMIGGKEDLAWLPEYDDDYEKYVYRLATEFGWPKGPITGFMLWNEPWEGLSISGWAADMVRYRTLYKRMGNAVFRARKTAGVDVLIGGCDSSTNTIDKLFPDGTDEFLPYLDFCSIHYQGLSCPALYPQWNNRKHYKGRVLIWDTESWVANTDDRFAAVVASNRAAGYDRAMGTLSNIAVSVLSHKRVAKDRVKSDSGQKTIDRPIESRPLAAAYGAAQHLLGEREFKEILFKNGLPWVYVFDGLDNDPDDGTVVVVGDLDALFEKGSALFSTVQPLQNAQPKMIIQAPGNTFLRYDVYGNPAPSQDGKIIVPLNDTGVFLRGNPKTPGSFATLINAIKTSQITGLEPLETIAYDMLAPIESNPTLRLRLTSMHNQPVEGALNVKLGNLKTQHPKILKFAPRERKWLDVKITGKSRPDNTYPLELTFDAGKLGRATHNENLHVNLIAKRRITVDASLNDFTGVLPQTISTDKAATQSLEEAMYLPFAEFKPGRKGGFALAYLAYDEEHFYFAAKISDDTPHPGTIRFDTRDEDADFYPKTSYQVTNGKKTEYNWPKGVRRFSYRQWPFVPSAMPQRSFDNVLIAFNAIPMEQDEWLTHLPGRMPKFIWYKSTDYEYALNKVADRYGSGTEIFRLMAPTMPYKHFFPRQPKHPLEGPVKNGKLEIRYTAGTRIVECALPWPEIPHVKKLLDEGKTVKFGFHINHENRSPDMELAMNRSAAEGISHSFHPNWSRSWPNEIEFAFEK